MAAGDSASTTRGRSARFAGVLLLLGVGVLELVAFASGFLAADLYDHRDAVLPRLDAAHLAARRAAIDPVLGWVPRSPSVTTEPNCLGTPIEYDTDDWGARTYPGYRRGGVGVVAVGDSYTRGDEVVGGESYPARLAERLGADVANLGVGGYGPTQALLRLERELPRYPEARVAVLAIMYENVFRMRNSYRAVLYDKSDPLSFKPFMEVGRLAPHPPAATFESVASARRHAATRFDVDFWAKPRHRFPYSVSLVSALRAPYFAFRKLPKRTRIWGRPEYVGVYRHPAFTEPLLRLLERFATVARAQEVAAVALFVPRNRLDTTSAALFLEASETRVRLAALPGLVTGDLGSATVDWARFNLEEPEGDDLCHPSAYGYDQIAAFAAERIGAARTAFSRR